VKRRNFITLLGGAAAWPIAARSQQGERMRRVAFLHGYAENDPEVLPRIVAFRQGLEALGWRENRNIRVEHRYSGGDFGRIQTYATELVRSAPDLIAGSGTAIIAALKQATDTIPTMIGKWLELLKEAGDVAAGMRQGRHETLSDRIVDEAEHVRPMQSSIPAAG
jgi:putative ABC transport system substrate-binding protein